MHCSRCSRCWEHKEDHEDCEQSFIDATTPPGNLGFALKIDASCEEVKSKVLVYLRTAQGSRGAPPCLGQQ
jgi:hypothetical protein